MGCLLNSAVCRHRGMGDATRLPPKAPPVMSVKADDEVFDASIIDDMVNGASPVSMVKSCLRWTMPLGSRKMLRCSQRWSHIASQSMSLAGLASMLLLTMSSMTDASKNSSSALTLDGHQQDSRVVLDPP